MKIPEIRIGTSCEILRATNDLIDEIKGDGKNILLLEFSTIEGPKYFYPCEYDTVAYNHDLIQRTFKPKWTSIHLKILLRELEWDESIKDPRDFPIKKVIYPHLGFLLNPSGDYSWEFSK